MAKATAHLDDSMGSVTLAVTMERRIRTLLLVLVVVFVLASLTVLFLTVGLTPPAPPLPNPNGYDDFRKAGWKVTRKMEPPADLDHEGLRLLVAEMALRCYRCDQESASGSLQRLVPTYLQAVPSDPFSSHPLVYRPAGTNWLLYSVGPDRVDDGGKPAGKIRSGDNLIGFGTGKSYDSQRNKGDLLYDSPW